MIKKIKEFINKTISNDNVSVDEVKEKQKNTIKYIVIGFIVLVILGTYMTADPKQKKEKSNIVGMSIVNDNTRDNIARNKWVNEGSIDLKHANDKLNKMTEENQKLLQEMKELREQMRTLNNKQTDSDSRVKKISQETYSKLLGNSMSQLKKQQQEAIAELNKKVSELEQQRLIVEYTDENGKKQQENIDLNNDNVVVEEGDDKTTIIDQNAGTSTIIEKKDNKKIVTKINNKTGEIIKKSKENENVIITKEQTKTPNVANTGDKDDFPIPSWVKKEQSKEQTNINYPTPNTFQESYVEEEEFLNNSLFFQSIEQPQEQNNKNNEEKPVAEDDIIEIPATSIVKAALLSGFDAPTLAQAKNSPSPILLKVTDLSIMANKRQQDLRDCFLLAEGYGDLASERAYLRTNTLHCVNENDDNIVVDFQGFVAGEDGKNGLRGRIVTKQGALIGRSIIAGVLQGIGDAFGSDGQVQIIGSGEVTNATNNSSLSNKELANKALGAGFSKAADKLADFYLKMADQISPVIEISAGREVDVIITKNVKINLNETKKYRSNLNREEEYEY